MNLTEILERRLLPIAEKVSNNLYLSALKNAFIALMPFLIVGSFFLLLTNFPIPGYNEFVGSLIGTETLSKLNYGIDASYGIMTLLVIITYSKELCDKLQLSQSTAIFPIAAFFLIIPGKISIEASQITLSGFSMDNFGAQSIFLGIIVSTITIKLMQWLEAKNLTINLPDGVPPEIMRSFKSLVPIFFVMLFWIAVKSGFELTSYQTMGNFISKILQEPLLSLGNSLFAQLISEMMISLFWFFGLHGDSIVSSIMGPIWQTLSAENLEATKQGLPAVNIITQQFRDVFLVAGGTGCTLGLIIAIFIGAKSNRLRELSKLASPAALFNINEPIIFGVPIVLNPLLLIPFLVTPMVLCTISYCAISFGLVPPTSGVSIPWTTPIFISGFLTTGVPGVILQAINLVIAICIYLPFIKVLDKQYLKEESNFETEELS